MPGYVSQSADVEYFILERKMHLGTFMSFLCCSYMALSHYLGHYKGVEEH